MFAEYSVLAGSRLSIQPCIRLRLKAKLWIRSTSGIPAPTLQAMRNRRDRRRWDSRWCGRQQAHAWSASRPADRWYGGCADTRWKSLLSAPPAAGEWRLSHQITAHHRATFYTWTRWAKPTHSGKLPTHSGIWPKWVNRLLWTKECVVLICLNMVTFNCTKFG